MKRQEFEYCKDLLPAMRRLSGPIYGELMAGADLDPIDIRVVKADAIAAVEQLGDYTAAPFDILTGINGANYLTPSSRRWGRA